MCLIIIFTLDLKYIGSCLGNARGATLSFHFILLPILDAKLNVAVNFKK